MCECIKKKLVVISEFTFFLVETCKKLGPTKAIFGCVFQFLYLWSKPSRWQSELRICLGGCGACTKDGVRWITAASSRYSSVSPARSAPLSTAVLSLSPAPALHTHRRSLSVGLCPAGGTVALAYPHPPPRPVPGPVPVPRPAPLGCCRAAPWPWWPCSPSLVEQPRSCCSPAQPAGADVLLLGHVPLPLEGCRVMGIHIPCLECTCSSSMELNFTLASFPLFFFLSENQT